MASDSREPVPGIDPAGVTAWLAERTEITPPLSFEVVEGGRSNLTYRVADADGRRLVLRRPPLHGVLESAHDMGREHRIISALAGSEVPVPRCIGYEPTDEVTGAPFYVMEHVDGEVIRDAEVAGELAPAARTAVSQDLVDVLVGLHATDIDAVGLGDLARREAYIERQLKRWHRQLQEGRTRELPLLDEVHDRLAAAVPEQGPAAIVHGDYRLDNLIVDPGEGRVRAVLDWELTTLGDPLADLGLLLVYWAEPGDQTISLLDSPTLVAGFASRQELIDRYAAASGRDLDDIGYFVAFGYWKLACVLEGVYTRTRSGAYGGDTSGAEAFGDLVIELGERAAEAAEEAGR
ncbi:MAG: phosphotransferase family protein [Nitriliruptoraceae bacterium]